MKFLLLGFGQTASEILKIININHPKSTIYATTRDKQKFHKLKSLNIEPVLFDLENTSTWKNIIKVDHTFWSFACKNQTLTFDFWNSYKSFLGKVVGIGSTSIYSNRLESIVLEESEKVLSHSRWSIEKSLIDDGAIWAIAAGIYKTKSQLARWMESPNAHPDNFVNLINLIDLARACFHISQTSSTKTYYNVTEGKSYKWSKIGKLLRNESIITNAEFENFLEKRKLPPKELKIKSISNYKLVNELGFELKNCLFDNLD